jgi:XRE family transcriptional regulator, regulator of sulfur utilization
MKQGKDPYLVALGKTIQALRVEKGMSQEKLAHAAGIYRNYVGMIERAETNVTIGALRKICGVLEIELSKLLEKVRG